jgi:hypothetical protein
MLVAALSYTYSSGGGARKRALSEEPSTLELANHSGWSTQCKSEAEQWSLPNLKAGALDAKWRVAARGAPGSPGSLTPAHSLTVLAARSSHSLQGRFHTDWCWLGFERARPQQRCLNSSLPACRTGGTYRERAHQHQAPTPARSLALVLCAGHIRQRMRLISLLSLDSTIKIELINIGARSTCT